MAQLPGSEKAAHPDATILGPMPDATVAITVVPTDPVHLGNIVSTAVDHNMTADVVNYTVKVSGTSTQMRDMFGVQLFLAQLPDGMHFRSRVPAGESAASISIPDALDGQVLAVLGFDTRRTAISHLRPSLAEPMYSPQQVAQLYNFPTDVHGEGQCVAVIELGGGYSNTDNQAAGIPAANVYFVGVDGSTNAYTGNLNSADGEVALDIQVIGVIARACKIGVYMGPNTDQGFYDAIAAAVHDISNKPSAISISWGMQESNWTQQSMLAMDALFASAAAAGIPVFAASGDSGSNDGGSGDNVDFPASAPNCLGCGGTSLPSLAQESVWNDTAGGGGSGGGGISRQFAVPSYQTGLGLSGRGVPDIAGDAAPSTGYAVHIAGSTAQFGGTSAVAPLYAAWAALARQKLGASLGDLHKKFYSFIGTAAFHDVTVGNNGTQAAKRGYDTCTGCGSPDGSALITALGGGQQPSQYTLTLNGPLNPTVGQSVAYNATLTPSTTTATYSWSENNITIAALGSNSTVLVPMAVAGTLRLGCTATVSGANVIAQPLTIQVAAVSPPAANCRSIIDTNCSIVQGQLKALAASDHAGGAFSRAMVYAYAAQWLVYQQQILDGSAGSADMPRIS